MPSLPSKILPIRVIRKAIGLNQGEMAELIGVSRPAIEKLENDKLQMSQRIAEQYHRQTGCDLVDGRPQATIDGDPFTKEAFLEHQESVHLKADEQKNDRIEALCFSLGLLLKASHERKMLLRLSEDVDAILSDLFRKNGLGDALKRVLENETEFSGDEAAEWAAAVSARPLIKGLELKGRPEIRHA
ncbi:MAG: helix-turn-helix transcriptional regulator [Verrucomicrobiales bacterium]|nr:helix-turn-helix transcriptional regulator [Verrucomicrobiales bacterium]